MSFYFKNMERKKQSEILTIFVELYDTGNKIHKVLGVIIIGDRYQCIKGHVFSKLI